MNNYKQSFVVSIHRRPESRRIQREYSRCGLQWFYNNRGGSGDTRIITNPILVRQGTTYDGKGEKLIAEGLGDGSKDEDQRPYFLLEPGAILKNVTIAAPETEGVHCMGNNIVDNVHWEDIGEDALSVRNYFPGGDITIMNGSTYNGAGTCFQFNTAVTVRISNFTASNVVDFRRQDYKFPFDMTVYLDNCTINNFENAIVKSEFPTCYVYLEILKPMNLRPNGGKY